jgi:protein SOK2
MAMQDQGAYGAPPQAPMDTTGQVAPQGVKPRVTATLWEDEGTLCFQVDVRGTCVARREGNFPTISAI